MEALGVPVVGVAHLDRARDLTQRLYNDYMNELLTFVDSVDLLRDWCIDCDAIVKQVEFLP